jgi:hypothetical protein
MIIGDVKLERLKIKTSALDFLHLPIAVKSGEHSSILNIGSNSSTLSLLIGYVEKVHVHADWASLGSQPVTINLQVGSIDVTETLADVSPYPS